MATDSLYLTIKAHVRERRQQGYSPDKIMLSRAAFHSMDPALASSTSMFDIPLSIVESIPNNQRYAITIPPRSRGPVKEFLYNLTHKLHLLFQ